MEIVMDEDAEVEVDYTTNLISNVIMNISEGEEEIKSPVEQSSPKKPELVPAIPEFELRDIMGQFEIDDLGNFIIIRGPNGGTDLLDKES